MNNLDLIDALKAAVKREREAMTEVLRYLKEVEKRKLHLNRGHSSLYVFCRRELGYSEMETHLRIQAMRLIRDLPEVETKIDSGELSLTVAAKIQTAARDLPQEQTKELVKQLSGASKRKAEARIAELLPEAPKPEKARALSGDRTEIRFTASKEAIELFEKLMDRMAHTNFERKYETLFVSLAEAALKKLEGNAALAPIPGKVTGRHISAAAKRAIWKRDQGKCQYRSADGHQCKETHGLQLDHIQPYALGGSNTEENLRLLCGAHNRYRARRADTAAKPNRLRARSGSA